MKTVLTPDKARRYLDAYISDQVAMFGSFKIPKKDVVVYSKTTKKGMVQFTFMYLMNIICESTPTIP